MNRKAFNAAKRGAALLDSRYKTWRNKIDLSDLDLSMAVYHGEGSCGCILAQIDYNFRPKAIFGGSFISRLHRLGVAKGNSHDNDYREAERLGFLVIDEDDDSSYGYEELTEAWKKVLA